MAAASSTVDKDWSAYLRRYADGEWRATVFHDMIVADVRNMAANGAVLLDIGCGRGFDDDRGLQESLARQSGEYIGIEPDRAMDLAPFFSVQHRCPFEDADIRPESIDCAFAVMVLEHLEGPDAFWDKLHRVLRPGGIFWGFTVDARHWFAHASMLAKRLHVKDWYLNALHGSPVSVRYKNYPVCYHSNTPAQIARLSRAFSQVTTLNFHSVGQLDYYLPAGSRWLSRLHDRWAVRSGRPGTVLAVRAIK